MPATLTAALANAVSGPMPTGPEGMCAEEITVTSNPGGSANSDTGTYTVQFLTPDRVICGGPLAYSIAGQVITFTTRVALTAGDLFAARVEGYAL